LGRFNPLQDRKRMKKLTDWLYNLAQLIVFILVVSKLFFEPDSGRLNLESIIKGAICAGAIIVVAKLIKHWYYGLSTLR
jgi:hypothetical protein